MKLKPTNSALIAICAAGLMAAGCAQQQQRHATTTPAPVANPGRPPQPSSPSGAFCAPQTFEENGTRWIRNAMGFPTGLRESSGLLVEKTVPAEVLAGQKFDYAYKVSNLTECPIANVTLMDRVSPNFAGADADPRPTDTSNGVATWQLGTLGPKESKDIHVKGSSAEEGTVTTCGWATYTPILCQDVKVVKANIQLTKTAPAEVLICDPIPVTLTVKNNGSSGLSGVMVTDTLPDGLTSDGKNSLSFDAGNLGPGDSRDFKFNAVAARTGSFVNNSQANSAQGVHAEATSTTVVHAPVLTVACTAPDVRYMGRGFDVSFTVNNTGDAPAAGTILDVPVPNGLKATTASNGGQVSAGRVTWDLGSVGVNSPQTVTASFTGEAAGNFAFNPSVKGTCAPAVSSSCQTVLKGVPAILLEKSDDPDPVGVGEQTTYTVRVTNQGFADDNNIKVVVTIAPELVPVSATGDGAISGQTVTFPVVPRLPAKEAVTYRIVAKGVKAGDGRTRFELNSDMLQGPVIAEESTHVY
jgi:uncharacterized repeat protein (TIGR01451 family)